MQRRTLQIELLGPRLLLAGDLAAETEPQYAIHYPPRLQPGNAPLIGTPAYRDSDQVDILWQTLPAGDGNDDSFVVEFRPADLGEWRVVPQQAPHDIGFQSRLMHTATIDGLAWDQAYEYRVQQWRAGKVVESYEHEFQTRLAPGDRQAFRFAAYGDSARADRIQSFRNVQSRISDMNLDFSVLLGDNIYTFGLHNEADYRFNSLKSPEAAAWTAEHIDYFATGNHDEFVRRAEASRELYSVPFVEAGVNAHVGLPD